MPDYKVSDQNVIVELPHSREAEEALLGSVLIDPEIYQEAAEKVTCGDFFIHRNGWVWSAFKSLCESKTPIDFVTVSEILDREGKLQEVGGQGYLIHLTNSAPMSYNATHYASIVRDCAVSRRMIAAANEIAKLGYEEGKSLDKRLSLAEKQWQAVRKEGDSHSRLLGMKELLTRAYDRLDAIVKLGRPPGIISNLIDLDKILHGFKKGRYYLIAGRPGDGKTALLLTLARNFMKYEGKSILYISIEMQENADFDDPISGGELSERLLGMEADIDTMSISDGRLEDGDWPKYTNAIEKMQSWRFTVDDDPGVTPDQILARALRVKGEIGLDVVIVDYIQIQETPAGEKFGTRAEQVAYLSKRMKKLAKELNVIMIVAAQVNRAYMARGEKRLVLSDLKESGSLEQDSHVVMFIQPTDDTTMKQVEVAKHRGGKVGACDLYFEASRTEFRNGSRRSEEVQYWWNNGVQK